MPEIKRRSTDYESRMGKIKNTSVQEDRNPNKVYRYAGIQYPRI
jgi:hypothetical protein